MQHLFVHLFHILIVGSLFLYIGIMRTDMPNFMFTVSLLLGVIIILYHIYKVYRKLSKNELGIWVNLIHMFIIGPILIYIGYTNKDTSRKYFEILLLLGFSAIGYHLYYLFY